ncbi:MAG: hypothetical protein JWP36_331 [Paucimonas sp.]|nr:hypothetical protein [Paucimonas sp.]
MSAVLVTGANGFVGSALCASLERQGIEVRRAVRDAKSATESGVGEIGPDTDWTGALAGCDTVVHAAARVHVMRDSADDPLAAFRAVNTAGTLNLAAQAAAAGVRRLVFISSVKVNGEAGHHAAQDEPAPADPYGVSKAEAEAGLHKIGAASGLETVVIRPPLVYGPGVGANFLRLMRAVDRGMVLPFGRVENRRSLIFVGNLASGIAQCLTHPAAAGRTWMISDGQDLSTPELVTMLAHHLGRPPRLMPVPVPVMRWAAAALGKSQEADRLLGNLTVDSDPIRNELGWQAPYSVDQGLAATVAWYRGRLS